MKVVVAGGSGLVGARLVARLRSRGYEAIAASRRSGVDAVTGEGLKEALSGAHTVVDVTNAPSFEEPEVTEFFRESSRRLLAAGESAGVSHHLALSVVGTQRLQDQRVLPGEGNSRKPGQELEGSPHHRAVDAVLRIHGQHHSTRQRQGERPFIACPGAAGGGGRRSRPAGRSGGRTAIARSHRDCRTGTLPAMRSRSMGDVQLSGQQTGYRGSECELLQRDPGRPHAHTRSARIDRQNQFQGLARWLPVRLGPDSACPPSRSHGSHTIVPNRSSGNACGGAGRGPRWIKGGYRNIDRYRGDAFRLMSQQVIDPGCRAPELRQMLDEFAGLLFGYEMAAVR